MGMDNYSLSDIAAVTNSSDGLFGGNCGGGLGTLLIVFLIISVFGGGFGGWGNCQRGNCATTEDLASGFNFSGLQNKTNEILAAVNSEGRTTDNAVCQLGTTMQGGFYQLMQQLSQCCCETQRAIDSVKFDMANYAAATNQTVAEWGQKVMDKLCAQENAALQARVNQLENQQAIREATAGIPRTNPYGYGLYAYPQCGGQTCNCGTIAY